MASVPPPAASRAGERLELRIADRTDAQLLADDERADEAFTVFYRRHVEALIRFTASRGLTAEAAGDVVADTFTAALEGRYDYRPEREHARLWLLVIVSRRITDSHRRRGAEGRRAAQLRHEAIALSRDDQESYDRLLVENDARALDALADLPAAQQDAVRARVLEERSYAEVAAALGLSQPAARQTVSRGLLRLRRKLEDAR